MQVTVRLLGLELLWIELTTDSDPEPAPRTFGFHGSGSGIIEVSPDTMLDTSDRS